MAYVPKKNVAEHHKTWFLLYGGTSCDGRGQPTYVGRTTCPKKALKHQQMLEKGSPYSLGHVEAITDTSSVRCGLNELQSRVDADKRIKAALKSVSGPFRKESPNE